MKTTILLLFACLGAFAQPYLAKNGKTRHRFAQTVFGFDVQASSGGHSAFVNSGGEIENFLLPSQFSPRIYISGTHFWGHAEFYFAFQVFNRPRQIKTVSCSFSQFDIFGTKIYPWPVQRKKIRPYAGMSISGITYRQISGGDFGPELSRIRIPLLAGLTYCSGKYLWDLGLSYNPQNRFNYFISTQKYISLTTPPFSLRIGLRKWLETTAGSEKTYLDGTTEKNYQALKQQKKLNSWFVGLGPSSAFFLKHSPYNQVLFPFMDKPFASTFPEITAGYFYEPFKIHAALAFRSLNKKVNAYGHKQQFARRSVSLESFRYLFDYHGFNPYAGICVSYEWLGFSHNQDSTSVHVKKQMFSPGIIFGWDILPDKLQWICLRTNLRYFPELKMKQNGKSIFMDQLEFNFIQAVFYPQRFKSIRKNRELLPN